jgi:hypothetical protein
MAISRFKHSIHAVKALAAAVALLALTGTAQATENLRPGILGLSASAVCGPAWPDIINAPSRNNLECWVRVMADKVQHGERLTMDECLIVEGMHGYIRQCEEDEIDRKFFAGRGSINPALYGGLPDAADPDEVRKHKQRGARDDAAMAAKKATSSPREIPLCVGNCR